jgi:hypothetical protein
MAKVLTHFCMALDGSLTSQTTIARVDVRLCWRVTTSKQNMPDNPGQMRAQANTDDPPIWPESRGAAIWLALAFPGEGRPGAFDG